MSSFIVDLINSLESQSKQKQQTLTVQSKITCRRCGGKFNGNDVFLDRFDKDYICKACYEEGEYLICNKCGKIVRSARNKPYLLYQGNYYCKTCRGVVGYSVGSAIATTTQYVNKKVCSCCGDWCDDIVRTETVKVKNVMRPYDGYPFSYAGHYHQAQQGEQSTSIQPNPTPQYRDVVINICGSCNNKVLYICKDCGKVISPNDGGKYYHIGEDYYCLTCGEKHSLVGKYHSRPSVLTYHTSYGKRKNPMKSELYLGMELEIDEGNDREVAAKTVLDILPENTVYLMRDGSLSQEKGFEITTHPMTAWYLTSLLKEHDFLTPLKDMGWKSGNGNTTTVSGIHFHISRTFFGAKEEQLKALAKMYKILTNSILNGELLKFCGKDKMAFIKYSEPLGGIFIANTEELALKSIEKLELNKAGRNVLINATKNTFEHRYFNGSLDVNIIIAYALFVYSLAWYVKERSYDDIVAKGIGDIVKYANYKTLNNYWKECVCK